MRLSEFFGGPFSSQFLAVAKSRTRSAYREAVDHFVRLIGDVEMDALTSQQLATFSGELVGRANLRPVTANKHLAALAAVLRYAGLPVSRISYRSRQSKPLAGFLEIRFHRREKPVPRPAPADTIEAIYRACPQAELPALPGVSPGHWWQALLAVALVETFRRGGLLSFRPPDRPDCWTHGLCWEHVLLREGKVILPAAADKAGAARPKPLHPIVVKHLLRIRGDWPEVFLWPRSEWVFYREWHRLQSAAGLSKAEQIRFHQIKATSATHYATSESPWVLQKMADHASILTSQHYVDPTAALRSAVDRFPLPAAFLEGFRDERRPALGG